MSMAVTECDCFKLYLRGVWSARALDRDFRQPTWQEGRLVWEARSSQGKRGQFLYPFGFSKGYLFRKARKDNLVGGWGLVQYQGI